MTSMRIPDAMHDADRNIVATVRALKAAQRKTTPSVLEPMHMSRNVWFSRMRGETSFTAAEVAGLARLFGVRVSDLYEGRVVLPTDRGPDGSARDQQRRHADSSEDEPSTIAWKTARSSTLLRLLPGGRANEPWRSGTSGRKADTARNAALTLCPEITTRNLA